MCTSFTLTAHGQTFCSDDGLCIFVRRRTNRHATGYQWSLQLGDRSPIPMALLERANS